MVKLAEKKSKKKNKEPEEEPEEEQEEEEQQQSEGEDSSDSEGEQEEEQEEEEEEEEADSSDEEEEKEEEEEEEEKEEEEEEEEASKGPKPWKELSASAKRAAINATRRCKNRVYRGVYKKNKSKNNVPLLLTNGQVRRIMSYMPTCADGKSQNYSTVEFKTRHQAATTNVKSGAVFVTRVHLNNIFQKVVSKATERVLGNGTTTINPSVMHDVLWDYSNKMQFTSIGIPPGLIKFAMDKDIIGKSEADASQSVRHNLKSAAKENYTLMQQWLKGKQEEKEMRAKKRKNNSQINAD